MSWSEDDPRGTSPPSGQGLDALDERLGTYADLVRRYGGRLDLVSPRDLERFEKRHVQDSLRLVSLLGELPPGPCVDVGSGAGLPGVPLALAVPGRHWRLLEPRARRAAFLEEVVRRLEIDCEVIVADAARAARDPRLGLAHVLATARALAPPAQAFELILPLVTDGGAAAVFSGARQKDLPREAEVWRPGVAIIRR